MASYIKGTRVQIMREREDANIDILEKLPVDEGLRWLLSLQGMGIKTSSSVLLFYFGKQIMPDDTNVRRVSLRTGLVPACTSVDKAHALLLKILSLILTRFLIFM